VSLFRRRAPEPAKSSGLAGTVGESLTRLVETAGRPSLFAPSAFVKRVDCPRCGAPKQLPSATAYVYCDHCGSLVDYDFRAANAGTSSGLTNTVFHQLVAPVQPALMLARVTGDVDRYRALYRDVYAEWIRQCPQAVSPRARNDEDFRARMVHYLVESTVGKDFDPTLSSLEQRLNVAISSLTRIPRGDQPWLVGDGIWPVADGFRQLMEATYQHLETIGVLALDPDESPAGLPLRMEYSTFCQGWVAHLAPEAAQRLLAMFGLAAEYTRVTVGSVVTRCCGGCGSELVTVPSARVVVCEACGRRVDVARGECRSCGSSICFPEGVTRLACPSCRALTQRT
jgi:DNA-directed RNA polymerase subunit RPC12/RpoP